MNRVIFYKGEYFFLSYLYFLFHTIQSPRVTPLRALLEEMCYPQYKSNSLLSWGLDLVWPSPGLVTDAFTLSSDLPSQLLC